MIKRIMKKVIYKEGDLVGPYNLPFIEEVEPHKIPSGQNKRMGIFKCTCNKHFTTYIRSVLQGNATNCGCGANSGKQKHGMIHTPIRTCWCNIKTRCYNPRHKFYPNYGGKGVGVYGPWLKDFLSFYNYVKELPYYGENGRSLDRINPFKDYEPGNLRWATREEQAINTRNNYTKTTSNGKTKSE